MKTSISNGSMKGVCEEVLMKWMTICWLNVKIQWYVCDEEDSIDLIWYYSDDLNIEYYYCSEVMAE